MVQQPTSRAGSDDGKDPAATNDSELSPAWSMVSGYLESDNRCDSATTCLQSSIQTLQYQTRLHHRQGAGVRADSSGSGSSDDDLYRAAVQAQQRL